MASRIIALAGAVSCLVIAAANPVHARQAAEPASHQEHRFDLPAQPLAVSLLAIARKSGANIVFDKAEIADRRAPALKGDFDAEAAVRRLAGAAGVPVTVTAGGALVVGGPGGSNTRRQISSVQERRGRLEGQVAEGAGARDVAGALVRIVETGEETRSDERGTFRFSDLAPGEYTLEVSFLGYPPLRQAVVIDPDATTLAIVTVGTSAEDEIVVYGSRSARAIALNLQRTAENNADVLAADDLGNFTGTTISEALRRAPGVAFQRNSVTGDGTNVIVRGMEPDMNAVKLNGLNLPVGSGLGRSADLSNLLADSVGRITIHKSLLPSQDSSGTGGLIEIETLSPLDRPRRYANLFVEGGTASKDFNGDFLASATVAGTFGAGDNFGLSASIQYRDHGNRSIGYDSGGNGGALHFGRSLPLDASGNPLTKSDAVDPLAIFPFVDGDDQAYTAGLRTSFYNVSTQNLAATLSAEWQIAGHTNLKLDFQHSESTSDHFSLSDTFSTGAEYVVLPGEGPNAQLGVDLAPGNAAISRSQSYRYDPGVKQVTDTYSFTGKTTLGDFELDYLAGYARGTERHPGTFELQLRMPENDASAELFLPEAIDGATGRIVTGFAPRSGNGIPLPLLSEAGWALVNDPSAFVIENASGLIDQSNGSNDRYTASGSLRWNANAGILRYIEAGAYFERAEFRDVHLRSQIGGGVPVSALGLQFQPSDLTRIGIDVPGFSTIAERDIRDFVSSIDTLVDGDTGLTLTPIEPHPDHDRQNTRETTFAAYFQTRADIGKLEIIGGLRYNRTELEATNLSFPVYTGPILPENGGGVGVDFVFQDAFTKLVTESTVAQDVLPRVLLNYRASDNLIFRGGYFLSVARPSIGQLSAETRIAFINFPIPGPEGVKPILQINSGNPDLKPATTHNFDISAELYSGVGVFKAGAFYKRIDNLLQTNITNGPATLAAVTLPDHPYFNGSPYFDPDNPDSAFITGGTPVNSDEVAELWGFEAQAERRFDFLPGVWGGFGVYLNYTFTQSSRTDRYNWAYDPDPEHVYEFDDLPFVQQPKHSGTAALTYNKYDIDATLTYGYQSRALQMFRPRGLSVYTEGVETLDFRGEYYLRPGFGNIRIFVEASDLLNSTSDPDLETTFGGEAGTPKFYTRATYLGGRRFKAGLSITF